MNEQLEHFLEAVKTDSQLLEKLSSMQTAAEIVEEAAQRGFNFLESDLTAAAEERSGESDAFGVCGCGVGGGGNEKTGPAGRTPYNCGCPIFGLGFSVTGYPNCTCFLAGAGWAEEDLIPDPEDYKPRHR